MKKRINSIFAPLKKRYLTALALVNGQILFAQNDISSGATALQGLTEDLKAYIDPITTVVYIIAAIMGIVGAVRVYSDMLAGKQNIWASASLWFGACLFLLIANVLLKSFFF